MGVCACVGSIPATGGVRLWLDGKLLLDDWRLHPGLATRSTEVKLEKAKNYALRLEHFRSDPGFYRGVRLLWSQMKGDDTAEAASVAARDADVVIAVVGITADLEGEEMSRADLPEGFKGGDRTTLDLPKKEEELLTAVKAAGLVSGRGGRHGDRRDSGRREQPCRTLARHFLQERG